MKSKLEDVLKRIHFLQSIPSPVLQKRNMSKLLNSLNSTPQPELFTMSPDFKQGKAMIKRRVKQQLLLHDYKTQPLKRRTLANSTNSKVFLSFKSFKKPSTQKALKRNKRQFGSAQSLQQRTKNIKQKQRKIEDNNRWLRNMNKIYKDFSCVAIGTFRQEEIKQFKYPKQAGSQGVDVRIQQYPTFRKARIQCPSQFKSGMKRHNDEMIKNKLAFKFNN